MLNKKSTRIIIGVIFLIFIIISFVPSLYLYNSSDGIINARTTTLKSPIEGVLSYASPIKCGAYFTQGEIIGKITNNRINKSFIHELMTEKKMLEGRVVALTGRLDEFSALKKNLDGNIAKYQKYAANQLAQQIKQTEEKLIQEKAEFERSKKEYDANKLLSDKQAVKKREFETSESSFLKSTSRIQENENKLVELKNSLSAVNDGVFLGDGHNDVPYSSQRRDQLVIETSLAQTGRTEALHRLEGIDRQIVTEQERLQKMECHPIVAPFNSLTWRISATEGSSIVIDSELLVLLNCSSIFLDVIVSESQFADIKSGDNLTYRLIGDNHSHKGKIFALRGSGSDLTDRNLAAAMPKDPKREFHVWAEISEKDIDLKPENFFQVGRRVEVKITRKWNLTKEITRFFNVF